MRWSDIQRPPPATLELKPEAFADTWENKPSAPVLVGLRTIGVLDLAEARSEAAREALAAHRTPDDPAAIEAYNDALLAWIVSRCTCDPLDMRKELLLWDGMPQETVKEALSENGLLQIFDAYERLKLEQDPTQQEATDDEIVRLPDVYAAAVPHLHGGRLTRVRRLLAFVLEELASVTEDDDGDG